MSFITDKYFTYKVTSLFLMIALVMMPEAAFAASDNQLGLAIKNGLCHVITALTGDIGKAIATLAVLILGIGAFFGKVNWGLAIMFAAGIVAIFGAVAIAGQFGGEVSC